MNLAKQIVSSTIKATLIQKPTFKPTINLSILETHLKKCRNLKHFNLILSQMIQTGFLNDTFAASRLLKFSTDSHFIHVDYPLRIFNRIQNPNGFIFNTLMKCCVKNNLEREVLGFYKLMLEKDVCVDNYTYPILVQACAVCRARFEGRMVHCHVLEMGFDCDVYVKNTLINMYGCCGNVMDARKVFDENPVLDTCSWNSMLAGYVQMGDVEEAKLLFDEMPGKNVIAMNSMIVLLGKMGRVDGARELFDEMEEKDMVSWSALISCYEQNKMCEQALMIFKRMKDNGAMVDEIVAISALSACTHLSDDKSGKMIHGLIVRIGIESYVSLQNALIHMYSSCGESMAARNVFNEVNHLDQISWNSMISGYLKCGSFESARELFDSMPEKDIVSWSTMISGYAQHEEFSEAVALFQKMQGLGVKPDETTLVSVISACSHLCAIDQGKWIHAYIKKNGLNINLVLGTTLVDFYMKCGCAEIAVEVFYEMDEKQVSTWNALIVGLAMNESVERSLDLFSEMKKCGVEPNEITFVGVLGACRHMGLVDEGRRFFDAMDREHLIKPNIKHYGCMVDLLGRAGKLKEAEELINTMPMAPDVCTWGALLGACKKHGNNEIGERVGKKLIELHPDHDGFHVLLSNIYASKYKWYDVLGVRQKLLRQKVVKVPGCSSIEADGVVHEFTAGDNESHSRINEIAQMLNEMSNKLKIEGYNPVTNEVSYDIDEEEKETSLLRHSEKLAIAFGLIAINPPTPIRIMKNLRICNDCHVAAKLVSKVFDREIVVRDRHRFHHFKQGSCSCSDYW